MLGILVVCLSICGRFDSDSEIVVDDNGDVHSYFGIEVDDLIRQGFVFDYSNAVYFKDFESKKRVYYITGCQGRLVERSLVINVADLNIDQRCELIREHGIRNFSFFDYESCNCSEESVFSLEDSLKLKVAICNDSFLYFMTDL